jgi:hypothetical protein
MFVLHSHILSFSLCYERNFTSLQTLSAYSCPYLLKLSLKSKSKFTLLTHSLRQRFLFLLQELGTKLTYQLLLSFQSDSCRKWKDPTTENFEGESLNLPYNPYVRCPSYSRAFTSTLFFKAVYVDSVPIMSIRPFLLFFAGSEIKTADVRAVFDVNSAEHLVQLRNFLNW